MNGSSPTLWLQDDLAPTVADELWQHRGVINVGALGSNSPPAAAPDFDDTFADLPGVDPALLGADEAAVLVSQRSYVRRNPRVRKQVIARSNGVCERPKCGETRSYSGFLDVHHIIGVAKSDRVYNCVAVCPNCHREAHFAPDRDELNLLLLSIAGFRSTVQSQRTTKGHSLSVDIA